MDSTNNLKETGTCIGINAQQEIKKNKKWKKMKD